MPQWIQQFYQFADRGMEPENKPLTQKIPKSPLEIVLFTESDIYQHPIWKCRLVSC